MERLPNEVLLEVFSYVDSVGTLVALRRVCKRWNEVANDPRAWASASLKCSVSSTGRISKRAAWALVHAPALGEVVFSASDPKIKIHPMFRTPKSRVVRLTRVLRRSQVPIRTIDLTRIHNMSKKQLKAVYAFLERQVDTMRSVSFELLRGNILHQEDILWGVSRLKNLQELTVKSRKCPPYSGEFHDRLVHLQRLTYAAPYGVKSAGDQAAAMVSDLLTGASASLRSVYLGVDFGSPAFVQALSGCHNLTRLTVNVGAASVLSHMPKLRQLSLQQRSAEDDWPEAWELPHSLPELRSLCFYASTLKGDLSRCGPSLTALAKAAPGLTKLDVRLPKFVEMDDDLDQLLGSLPQLRSVSLSHGGRKVVPRLVSLKHLEEVDVHVKMQPEIITKQLKMLKKLKRRRPSIEGQVKLTPIITHTENFTF